MLSWYAKEIIEKHQLVPKLPPVAPPAQQLADCAWRTYVSPENTRDMLECLKIDEANRVAWEFNRFRTRAVEELFKQLKSCGTPPVNPPPCYMLQLTQYLETIMYTEEFKIVSGIRYAQDEMKKTVLVDFKLTEVIELTEKHAAERFVLAECSKGPIDLKPILGAEHAKECTCGSRWDGRSPTCGGSKQTVLGWKRTEKHHCLRPMVAVIEKIEKKK